MKRLLIANRGEIARRIIRTAHRMGVQTVAVYSDADAQALHGREATQAVGIGGLASADSYLRMDRLIDAARTSGADAVHPGYGFLSENADFAQAVLDAGLVWVGPPPAAIRALGDKAAAKRLARAHGVPVLPGYDGDDQSDACLLAEGARIGAPLMVKASAGGGGRGMRLVTDLAQLPQAIASARSEAQAAFGSGALLLERALLAPRHVEVQVFADTQGQVIHLGERDCSVQRRNQKIIEESPSPAVDAALRGQLGAAAVALARAAGYVGAGTVEFLLDGGAFHLMEMNTRLQVEHPVTEMVTGLDLVEWQIRVARGEPLPLTQDAVRFAGHAIEVRLCAEDERFTPHSGAVRRFRAPAGADAHGPQPGLSSALRFDHALAEGLAVPPHYDSMLGKLIAHAPTRGEAIDRLAAALDATQLLGLPTNRAFAAACLRHEAFRAGRALIPFLSEEGDAIRDALQKQEHRVKESCGAVAIFASETDEMVPSCAPLTPALACAFTRPLRLRHRGQVFDAPVAGRPATAPGVVAVAVAPRRWHVQHGAVDLFIEDASYDPPEGSGGGAAGRELRAPFNGKVVAVRVAAGDAVAQGDVLVVVESMKLEHSLAAARAGMVTRVAVEVGQQVAPGQLLVALD